MERLEGRARLAGSQLTKENAELKQRVATVQGPDAAERAARKLGMVEPGEGSYVVRGLNR